MGDWQTLRQHVATRYRVLADETTKYQNPDFDGLSVSVPTMSGDREVLVFRRNDHDGVGYFHVYGVISTPSAWDARSCLEWNGRSPVGTLALVDGILCYKRFHPIQGLDIAGVDALLEEAAGWGAGLESTLAESGSV